MAQKTAMQELIEYLDPIHSAIKDKAIKLLEMEKKQIEIAFSDGQKIPINSQTLPMYSREEYYNDTYND